MPLVYHGGHIWGRPTIQKHFKNLLRHAVQNVANVSGVCYYPSMNTLSEPRTNVFCSFCGSATPDFVEWADEFYCEAKCVAFLPTPEVMEAEREEREANAMARELSGLMDEVEARGGIFFEEDRLRIEYLANYLDWFYPDKLDPRFS